MDDLDHNLIGLLRQDSRLPVASLVCVDVIRSEVCCRFSRFDRTPAERTISLMVGTFLVLAVLTRPLQAGRATMALRR